MTTPELPDLSRFNAEQLLAIRGDIDARLEEIRAEVVVQAERLGLAVRAAKAKRRGRKPKDETPE